MLNNNNKESKSTQFKSTYSEASNSYYNVSTIDKLNAVLPYNLTSKLISNRFDITSQLLLFDYTNCITNSSNASSNNNNNAVINNKCLLTKQQRLTLSCSNLTLNYNSLNKLEDNYVFNVIAINNNKDAQPLKQQRLLAVSCKYLSLASIISKLQEDKIDQAQSLIAVATPIQQLDLRSSYNCYYKGIAKSASNNSKPLINSKLANIASSVTVTLQSINAKDP